MTFYIRSTYKIPANNVILVSVFHLFLPLNEGGSYGNCPIAEVRQRSEELIIGTDTKLKAEKSSAEDKLANPNFDMAQCCMYTALD